MTWTYDETHVKLVVLLDPSCRTSHQAVKQQTAVDLQESDREDIVMLGLGGNSEDVEDDGEGDTEFRDVQLLLLLLGNSGMVFSAPSPGGNFEGRRVDAFP